MFKHLSPADMLCLEALLDHSGVENVMVAIAALCGLKATTVAHVAANDAKRLCKVQSLLVETAMQSQGL
jgi:hypothetical protein